MNFNRTSQTILGISVAAILGISVFSVIGVQEADADGFNGLKGLLKSKNNTPHFKTEITSAATVPLVENDFTGNAKAWFIYEDGEIKLKYRIKTDMDMNAGWAQTPDTGDDITKIHLHNNEPGVAGPHVLNVFKAPSQDDDDLVLKPQKGVIRGIWDTENTGTGPGNSKPLAGFLDELCAGNIYANVHGTTAEGGSDSGSLRGNLEPTERGERICKFLEKKGVI